MTLGSVVGDILLGSPCASCGHAEDLHRYNRTSGCGRCLCPSYASVPPRSEDKAPDCCVVCSSVQWRLYRDDPRTYRLRCVICESEYLVNLAPSGDGPMEHRVAPGFSHRFQGRT